LKQKDEAPERGFYTLLQKIFMSEESNAHLMVTFSGVSNNFLTVKRKFLMIFEDGCCIMYFV